MGPKHKGLRCVFCLHGRKSFYSLDLSNPQAQMRLRPLLLVRRAALTAAGAGTSPPSAPSSVLPSLVGEKMFVYAIVLANPEGFHI